MPFPPREDSKIKESPTKAHIHPMSPALLPHLLKVKLKALRLLLGLDG